LLPTFPPSELAALAATATLQTYNQGDALFHEGDASDGLHLIRRGSVTVSRRRGDGEQVLAYLPAGNVVGEIALFSPEGKRSATVKATIFTETIRIPPEAISPFIARHDELRAWLKQLESERMIENTMRGSDRRASGIVDFLMNAGAGEATDILLIDEALCVRCDNCETACATTHGGVSRLDREAGPTYATVHVPTSCRHCENPKCMTDCPPDALRRHPSGEVYILDNCIGCGNCAANCPYGVIQMAAVQPKRRGFFELMFGRKRGREANGEGEAKLAVKCDLCRDLEGRRGEPRAAVRRVVPHGRDHPCEPQALRRPAHGSPAGVGLER
jgi:Fe-S-cluster-containing hydrogenase component 2